MIRDVGEAVGREVVERAGRLWGQFQEATELSSDLLESDDAYLVVFDTPGATGTDVQVRYVEGAVFVRVDRFRAFREGYEMRFPGRGMALDGRVELPDDAMVDPDTASATLRENGTLEVRIPKGDDAPETIPVESEASPGGESESADHDGDEASDAAPDSSGE